MDKRRYTLDRPIYFMQTESPFAHYDITPLNMAVSPAMKSVLKKPTVDLSEDAMAASTTISRFPIHPIRTPVNEKASEFRSVGLTLDKRDSPMQLSPLPERERTPVDPLRGKTTQEDYNYKRHYLKKLEMNKTFSDHGNMRQLFGPSPVNARKPNKSIIGVADRLSQVNETQQTNSSFAALQGLVTPFETTVASRINNAISKVGYHVKRIGADMVLPRRHLSTIHTTQRSVTPVAMLESRSNEEGVDRTKTGYTPKPFK